MQTSRSAWLSVSQNNFDNCPGVPQVTRRPFDRSRGDIAFHASTHYSPGEIQGLRQLPRALVETIFILATAESNFTRNALIDVCTSWREIALGIPALWSRIKIGVHAMLHDSLPLYMPEGVGEPVAPDAFHIHLASPGPGQLFDLVLKAPPECWESLHITLGEEDPSPSFIEDIFVERQFPNLRELVIDEEPLNNEGMYDLNIKRDPYTSLYQSLCFTTTHRFKTININADIRGEASAYGLFGHAMSNVGGSIPFIRTALLAAAGSSEWRMASSLTSNISVRKYHYSHIVSLDLHSWDADVVEKLSLPNLLYLRVEHCHLERDQTFRKVDDCRPALLMPTVVQLRLTSHSLTMLSQICAGNLELLIIEDKKGMDRFDGCLPASVQTQPTPPLPTIPTRAGPRPRRVTGWNPVEGEGTSTFTVHSQEMIGSSPAAPWPNLPNYPTRDRFPYRELQPRGSGMTPNSVVDVSNYSTTSRPYIPFEKLASNTHLGTFQVDKWSVLNIETATFRVPLEIQSLLEFLRNARSLRRLTVTVPSFLPPDGLKEWKREFVERMMDRQYIFPLGQRYPDRPLFCCPQLEELTLLIDGVWIDGEWTTELKNLMAERGYHNAVTGENEKLGRGEGHLRSIVCHWSQDPWLVKAHFPPPTYSTHQVQSEGPQRRSCASEESSYYEQSRHAEQLEAYDGITDLQPVDNYIPPALPLSPDCPPSLPLSSDSPPPLSLSSGGIETASEHSQEMQDLPEMVVWSSSEFEVLSDSDFSHVGGTLSRAEITDDSEDYVMAREGEVDTDSDEDWLER